MGRGALEVEGGISGGEGGIRGGGGALEVEGGISGGEGGIRGGGGWH